jgi:hypothetical protein
VNFTAGSQASVLAGIPATLVFLGSASLNAFGANNTFVVAGSAGAGQDTIAGFQTGSDVVQFDPALFANFAAVVQHMSQVGADTVIQHDANTSVTLTGINANTLTASNFHFVSS